MKYTGKIDRMDVLDYAMEHGREAAANLLLLAGPDGYAGSYENYKDLEDLLNSGCGDKVQTLKRARDTGLITQDEAIDLACEYL